MKENFGLSLLDELSFFSASTKNWPDIAFYIQMLKKTCIIANKLLISPLVMVRSKWHPVHFSDYNPSAARCRPTASVPSHCTCAPTFRLRRRGLSMCSVSQEILQWQRCIPGFLSACLRYTFWTISKSSKHMYATQQSGELHLASFGLSFLFLDIMDLSNVIYLGKLIWF